MKKYGILLFLVLFCLYALCAEASEGSIEIEIQERDKFTFTCTKIASFREGVLVLEKTFQDCNVNLNQISCARELNDAAKLLQERRARMIATPVQADTDFQFTNLSPGAYLIEGTSEDGHQVLPSLVTIPETGEMNVTIIPKIEEPQKVAQTGDGNEVYFYFFSSFLALVLIIRITKKFTMPFYCGKSCDIMGHH